MRNFARHNRTAKRGGYALSHYCKKVYEPRRAFRDYSARSVRNG